MSKTCPNCQRALPATTEHFRRRAGVEGKYLTSWCIECIRKHARERQAARRANPIERIKVLEEKRRHLKSARGKEWKRGQMIRDNAKQRHRRTKRAMRWMWSSALWEETKALWGNRCAYCGTDALLTQDHFIPLAREDCPGTVPWNMVPACLSCNCSKGQIHPKDWIKDGKIFVQIAEILSRRRLLTSS